MKHKKLANCIGLFYAFVKFDNRPFVNVLGLAIGYTAQYFASWLEHKIRIEVFYRGLRQSYK